MIPILFGQGPAAESHRGIAIVVIGGQSLCLLITLLVTPVAYSLFDDLEAWVGRTIPVIGQLSRRLLWRKSRQTPVTQAPVTEEAFGD